MKNQFVRKTSGWIPVSVLVLFAIALVAGQARANLPNEIKAAPLLPAATATTDIVSKGNRWSRLDALPVAVDTLSAVPPNLEAGVDTGTASLNEIADRLSLQKSQTTSQ